MLLAFWPVWRWYVLRMLDPTDESWGFIALCTAIVFVLSKRSLSVNKVNLLPVFCVLLTYILAYAFVPPIIRACLAMVSVGLLVSNQYFGRTIQPGIVGLLVISLPLISSFQFYLGYPLRLLASHLSIPFLHLTGCNAYVEGVIIHCNNSMIVVDAPCTGIRMGWVAFFLCYFLATYYNFNVKKTLLTMSGTSFCVLVGNVVRATSLVHVEVGNAKFPSWTHEAIGILSFVFVSASLCFFASKLNKGIRWLRFAS